ncbi:Transposase and inactivated derivatives [hydrothermal vent metagenome]|uniref:Transposase and inactivated derivatives n=1 Tax=hydrothermal vent metagenome TaxID=652676 RepID=A0A3B0W6N3_9ZZZZ
MTIARKYQISVDDTPFYHIMTRCVRRAFLCGKDKYSGNCYEHRRGMIVARIKQLTKEFNIDVCSYAVMSNHYHLVLKVNSTKNWSEKQVLTYWSQLCAIKPVCQKLLNGEAMSKFELKLALLITGEYRKRLMSISWFMKLLNEFIARAANKEDEVTGHFWEARFKSQALLDERALLSCMAYVDLNPIRAAMAQTPKALDYTSIAERLRDKRTNLLGFATGEDDIPYKFTDYCDLLDATGRLIIADKPGFISGDLAVILQRFNLDGNTWLDELNQFKTRARLAAGSLELLQDFYSKIKAKIRIDNKLKLALE